MKKAKVNTPTTLNLAQNCVYTLDRWIAGGNWGLSVSRVKTFTIVGNGATLRRPPGTAEGEGVIAVAGSLTLKDVTVTGGTNGAIKVFCDGDSRGELTLESVRVTGNSEFLSSAGIVVGPGATLTAVDSTIDHNSAPSHPNSTGGGLKILGALVVNNEILRNQGTATLYNTVVEDNSAAGGKDRGTVIKDAGGDGGGIYNDGALTLDGGSRVTGNISRAGEAGLGGEGAGIYNTGTLTIKGGSVITGNTAVPFNAGGKSGLAGGVYNSGTVTRSDDSRIDGNTPQNCAGPKPVSACTN
jgi:hypothetical protein